MLEKPSKDSWVNWVQHPVTQFYLSGINSTREMLKEGIAEGAAGENIDQYIGRCIGIRDCIDYAIKDFEWSGRDDSKEEKDENES